MRYYASDMQLKIHSDSSYLSEHKDKSRIGGYYVYHGNTKNSSTKTLINGPLICHKTEIKHMVSYLDEAEFGAFL
jgi:hypothetical protein